jgi:hypothetical protein
MLRLQRRGVLLQANTRRKSIIHYIEGVASPFPLQPMGVSASGYRKLCLDVGLSLSEFDRSTGPSTEFFVTAIQSIFKVAGQMVQRVRSITAYDSRI